MDTMTLLKQFKEDSRAVQFMAKNKLDEQYEIDRLKNYNALSYYITEMERLNYSEAITAVQTARIYLLETNALGRTKTYQEIMSNNENKTAKELQERIEPFTIESLHLPARSIYLVLEPYVKGTPRSMLITNKFVIGFFSYAELPVDTHIPHLMYYDNEWIKNDGMWFSGSAMAVKMAIDLINSQTVIRYNGLNDKAFLRSQAKIFKKEKTKPREYYRVELKKAVIEEQPVQKDSIRTECNYAYDVRGHNCYRIIIGELPMDRKTEQRLKKDVRRKIFLSKSEIDADVREELDKRDITIKEGQWIAVLKYWVEPHIANLKNGKNQYIPSIKTITK